MINRPHAAGRRGFLLYQAIGDAHGMAYEFAEDIAAVGPLDLTYKSSLRFPAYEKGHYSDDTQMSIGVAELLLQYPPAALTPTAFADRWVEDYRRDPRADYSRRMQETFERAADGASFSAAIDPSRGTTSGALMRVAPIGLLPDAEEVKRLAALQARITHDTPKGILSAQAVALAVHAMHYDLCASDALDAFTESRLGVAWRAADDGGDPKNGLYIAKQAIDAVHGSATLGAVLKACIAYGPGQDTDTISAAAMAIAARSGDIADDLPCALFDDLENGPYGRDFIRRLDRRLLGLFPALAMQRTARPPSPAP